MKSNQPYETRASNMRAVAGDLRVRVIPLWGTFLLDVALATLGAVLVRQGVIAIANVHWHTAAVIGVAAGEALAAFLNFVLALRWKSSVRSHDAGWPNAAYDHFNQYLGDSSSILDHNNVSAAAGMVAEIVEQQSWAAHLWHASVGIVVSVPACFSVLAVATQQGAPRERMFEFFAPVGVVVGLATMSLVLSCLAIVARRTGLANWKVDVCDRRVTEIARGVQNAAPPPAADSDSRIAESTSQRDLETSSDTESDDQKWSDQRDQWAPHDDEQDLRMDDEPVSAHDDGQVGYSRDDFNGGGASDEMEPREFFPPLGSDSDGESPEQTSPGKRIRNNDMWK